MNADFPSSLSLVANFFTMHYSLSFSMVNTHITKTFAKYKLTTSNYEETRFKNS